MTINTKFQMGFLLILHNPDHEYPNQENIQICSIYPEILSLYHVL